MSFLCLYFGEPDSCPNCGGWTKVEGGPFQAADGVTYCSEDCAEEAAEMAAKMEMLRTTDWCPECGYDNHEHSDACPIGAGL